MINDNEIWKDIIGYEGLYQISNLGNIKTFNWRNTGKTAILKLCKNKNGYLGTALTKNGKLKSVEIHRLLALHFLPNTENKKQVNHINGIKADNNISNLEWLTQKENIQHAFKTGLNKGLKGEKNGRCKLTNIQVIKIRQKYNTKEKTVMQLSNEYNMNWSTINDLVKNITWKHLK